MPLTQHRWLNHIADSQPFAALRDSVDEHLRTVVDGSWGSSANLIAGLLAATMQRPVLLVVAHLDEADDALEDLELLNAAPDGRRIAPQRFGALEVLPGESNVSLELLAERLAVVDELATGDAPPQPRVLVASVQALMQSIPEPDAVSNFALRLKRGQEYGPATLLDWLDRAGYQRTDAIEQPGDFATRGGIVDLYLPNPATTDLLGPTPVRIDYFGDEIDTLRLIDTDTLGSGQSLDAVQIVGASTQRIQSDERTTTLLSLLPKHTVVVLHEVMELAEQARGYYERLTNPRGIYSPQAVLGSLTRRTHVEINQYTTAKRGDHVVSLPLRSLPAVDHDASQAIIDLAEHAGELDVTVLCSKHAEGQRLQELIREHAPAAIDRITIADGYIHRGFVWEETKCAESEAASSLRHAVSSPLLVLPHHELFHRYETRRRIRKVSAALGGRDSDAFFDLEVGDYVVHVEHGIARFNGLKQMRRQGKTEDYLTLEFAGKSLLHVPATQVELVQKYIGGFEGRPPLSTLGGKRWQKQKEQVKEAVKDMAAELLRVQAARAALPGIRYPADTAWQREFEEEFPYQETDDQLAAIAAIKKDMSDEQPMDRLICGDVGFGKTEVAIRAAFKAAEFGKQVAVLVPTTVLAEQHERTFRARMADYPFRIESVSRFKTDAEARDLLKHLTSGRVDIIIGTHRLLSKDVKFADLGLVIVDEEQRFGVEHKQKLLEFRLTADVLTLTATPIPRTLHMSMLGLRDISSLSTPPLDRRAIVTEVIPFDRNRIKTAIIRELNRDGQIYFVHNRVHNIQSIAHDIKQLVPEAKIIVGHGQMPGRQLEDVMLKFYRRQVDVLVSTTIIESGVDIPTANTMIINNADHFGLADLHQLRGRVGRYKHRAYCYLMLPEERPVTDKAAKRLKAIEQFSMLGAGFKIAMRDLEIRGAGNILGPEQSGHIAAVGYQMYCHMLEQEARRLKDRNYAEPVHTHLELPAVGRITPQWIKAEKYRMDAYRRISRAASLDELDTVVAQLSEAYGEAPEQSQTLLDLAEIRIAAAQHKIEGIKLDGPDVIFRTKQPKVLDELMQGAPGRVSLIDERTVYFRPPGNYLESVTLLAVLRKILVRPLREAAVAV